MPESRRPVDDDDLEWLHNLARSAVRDVHEADDIAQEVCVIAILKGHDARNRRAWLRRVLENTLRCRARRKLQRRAHEREAARAELVPSSCDVAARAERRRHAHKLMRGLANHYRVVLQARILDGKTPRAAAADLGLPVETVRTRTRRALGILRDRTRQGLRDRPERADEKSNESDA